MLEKTGTADQAVFLCYSSAAQARKNLAGRKAPPICVIIDVSEEDTHQDDWDLIEPYRDALRPAVYTVTFDTDDHSITRPETIRKIRRSGARVWGNTMWDQQSGGHSDARSLDDPQQGWGWMIDRGFNIIQTDEGEKLLNYLRSQNRHW
jgi:glycerophosphoryl diester phosphodiesterase